MTATSYITAAQMRDGALYPYLDVPSAGGGSVSNDRILAMGTAASRRVDSYCSDHFHATTGGTILVEGNGRYTVPLPKRVRAVTSVTLIDYVAAETAVTSDYYRVETSFDNIAGLYQSPTGTDALTLLKPLEVGNQGGNWPTVPWQIRIVGDFDWATTPEEVVHATALIVWTWSSSDIPPNVESVDSATVRFTKPRPGADTTGVIDADLLLQDFRRTQFGKLMRV